MSYISYLRKARRRNKQRQLSKSFTWYHFITTVLIATVTTLKIVEGWTSYLYQLQQPQTLGTTNQLILNNILQRKRAGIGSKRFRKTTLLHQSNANDNSSASSSTATSAKVEQEQIIEEELTDVDTRVLRAMLQEEQLNLNDENELRKLLERGTVKKVKYNIEEKEEDDSVYSSQVLKTLTDTKLWKKLSKQTSDLLESARILVVNKIEQDLKVVTALGFFTFDRIQQDIARALPATSSNNIPKQILLLTNRSAFSDINPSDNLDSSSTRSIRDEMSRPQDEIKSVSRELFAILSGERTNYYNSRRKSSSSTSGTQQSFMSPSSPTTSRQRGLRTVAPAGTAFSAERQRRALQQKRKLEQSKKQNILNPTNVMVDSVWELRQEMKSEVNVPGYKTEPIRNALAASVSATNNLLQGVRQKAQLVAAATIRNKDQQTNEMLLLDQQKAEVFEVDDESQRFEKVDEKIIADAIPNNQKISDIGSAPQMSTLEQKLFNEICTERLRIKNQITVCIDQPTDSWLTTDVVDTFDSLDFISSPGMENSVAKMILLRDEIENNHKKFMSQNISESEVKSVAVLETAINDLIAIRTAIEYLYNCTVQDVGDVVAEEIRFFILFSSPSTASASSTFGENVPLILRIEDEVQLLEEKQEIVTSDVSIVKEDTTSYARNSPKMKTPVILDAIADAVLVDVSLSSSSTKSVDDIVDIDEILSSGVAEIVSDDDFINAIGEDGDRDRGSVFKQVYNINDDDEDDTNKQPNILIVAMLRSIDVVLFVTEKFLTVGVPGTVRIISNIIERIDDVNRLGLGAKGWKEFSNIAKGKGRY